MFCDRRVSSQHQSPRFHSLRTTKQKQKAEVVLPVVAVRDPYSWFRSMCKVRYSAHWYHIVPEHCPNFISTQVERDWYYKTKSQLKRHYENDVWKIDNVLDKANYTLGMRVIPLYARYKSETRNHDSLAHMWKDWYADYYDETITPWPRLMVRLEDLVFYPHETIQQICDCVEGEYVGEERLTLKLNSSKGVEPDHIHGSDKPGYVKAMLSHILNNRTEGMTPEDADYAAKALEDSVMQIFGYKLPR